MNIIFVARWQKKIKKIKKNKSRSDVALPSFPGRGTPIIFSLHCERLLIAHLANVYLLRGQDKHRAGRYIKGV